MRDRTQVYLHLAQPLQAPSEEKRRSDDPRPRTILEQNIYSAQGDRYDGVCLSITNDEWKKRWASLCLSGGGQELDAKAQARTRDHIKKQQTAAELWRANDGFRREEVNLTKLEEAENAVGMASEWLELDSPDEWVRLDSELALRQELAYASYLNLAAVILPPPRNREHVADYARAINGCFYNTPPVVSSYLTLSIRIPLGRFPDGTGSRMGASSSEAGSSSKTPALSIDSDGQLDMWEVWDVVRTVCSYNPRLTLTLDLSLPLLGGLDQLTRWSAEPLRNILLPASSFVANSRGYPVLPKATQTFIRDMIKHRPGIILTDTEIGLHRMGGNLAYQQYVRYLEKTSASVTAQETAGSVESFAEGYWDYLQAPLQPLMDNLQSTTYEVFERDPVKYAKYEQAVYLALCDKPLETTVVMCVAGAGRGPLVSGCLRAVTRSGRKATIYAVEKNASAFVTLQERRDSEWGPLVQLVFGDMRTIAVPEKADILVSELLGSFGDNELSPECLDGAGRFLKDDGISIPSSYTAHISPLSSSKLYNEARGSHGDAKGMETPYVVMFQAVNQLAVEPQECWAFDHPRREAVIDSNGLPYTNSHNTRSAHLTFNIPQAGILHGLAGYFEACLYGDVGLSIHPHRMEAISPNMLSWFPIFFPLKDPLYLPANSEIDVSVWRLTDKRKVWYEWFVESFYRVPVTPSSISAASPTPVQRSGLAPVPENDAGVLAPPSPMVDAPSAVGDIRAFAESQAAVQTGQPRDTRMKIGQSVLQNPGGRSSWIGL